MENTLDGIPRDPAADLAVLGAFAIATAWGAAISTMGYERFVPGPAIAAWAMTTGLFLALRSVFCRLRAQQGAAR